MKFFNIVHHDGAIQVRIDDNGCAIITVDNINDHAIVDMAIIRAFREGAKSGTLFTGEVVNDRIARMHLKRVERGTHVVGWPGYSFGRRC